MKCIERIIAVLKECYEVSNSHGQHFEQKGNFRSLTHVIEQLEGFDDSDEAGIVYLYHAYQRGEVNGIPVISFDLQSHAIEDIQEATAYARKVLEEQSSKPYIN
ncbi:MAG: hypothetical protein GY833_21900 [Aestuariibacter sp.]|nr:hypothetical protein [Aestuariibacter sp.]|tara:strand:+ start:88225 stop:88536 length:312 start_codon:yes stop_codon:yes gene_type:complete